ncbi:MAG TPA: serine/threonine-protein kinase [Thermoanaerobaculia bacterium]|nr:serine/threonine-protein kinase [Thermoanaerobaculia bacterium]
MAICVWCGFDRLEESAELCAVCGQTPDSHSVTIVKTADGVPTEERTPATMPQVDRVFASRYHIVEVVGRGGMGSVFRVTDERDRGTYALKVLHAAAGGSSWSLKRFRREAEILGRIAHPAVPKIHDFGVVDDSMYLLTDFIDGTNLRDVIAGSGALPVGEVVRIGSEVADCLNAAHEHGVVHRDMKPHNVMLTRDGQVRLIDFGVARDAAVNATAITATGFTVGTPQYMSPEQFNGVRVDARSDIYSLGVVLFEASTGRLPFHGDTPTALGMKHVGEPPPHPRALRAEIPMLLNRIILKCLEKNPADRYPTAGDLARDLRRSAEAKRSVQRTRAGDFIVHEDIGEEWALVLASSKEKPDGQRERPCSTAAATSSSSESTTTRPTPRRMSTDSLSATNRK